MSACMNGVRLISPEIDDHGVDNGVWVLGN